VSALTIDTATSFYLGAPERLSAFDRARTADLAVALPADPETSVDAPSSVPAGAFVDQSTATALVFSGMRPDVRITQSLLQRAVDAYSTALADAGEGDRSRNTAQLGADRATAEAVTLQPLLSMLMISRQA